MTDTHAPTQAKYSAASYLNALAKILKYAGLTIAALAASAAFILNILATENLPDQLTILSAHVLKVEFFVFLSALCTFVGFILFATSADLARGKSNWTDDVLSIAVAILGGVAFIFALVLLWLTLPHIPQISSTIDAIIAAAQS